ncbi:MAG: hypothetical protein HFJ40_02435 [Clostridia bacterium]|nr:hypothetical protein [Clostridia bacterium]
MAKNKKNQTPNIQPDYSDWKDDLIILDDCTKNNKCGVSTTDGIKVIVFYNGSTYKVKILVKKELITGNVVTAINSQFDLYLKFHDNLFKNSSRNLHIELNRKYRMTDRKKSVFDCEPVRLGIKHRRYHGTIILQPDLFIPEEWSPLVDTLEDEIAYKKYKSDIRRMEMTSKNHTNYEKHNAHKPFQGGDCTGGR